MGTTVERKVKWFVKCINEWLHNKALIFTQEELLIKKNWKIHYLQFRRNYSYPAQLWWKTLALAFSLFPSLAVILTLGATFFLHLPASLPKQAQPILSIIAKSFKILNNFFMKEFIARRSSQWLPLSADHMIPRPKKTNWSVNTKVTFAADVSRDISFMGARLIRMDWIPFLIVSPDNISASSLSGPGAHGRGHQNERVSSEMNILMIIIAVLHLTGHETKPL